MGFALWIDGDMAWAQGTHEYRPMGSAVIGSRGVFSVRDFKRRLHAPSRFDARFSGFFASIGEMNDFLRLRLTQSRRVRLMISRRRRPVPPPF